MNSFGVPITGKELEVGTLLLTNGFSAEALPYLQNANPNDIRTMINLGVCYRHTGRFDEALAQLQNSVAVKRTPLALSNIGSVMEDLGNYRAATDWHAEAFSLADLKSPQIALNYAFCLLREGRFAEAWPLYEFGRSPNDGSYPNFPRWDVEKESTGKRILICPEGGYGDGFMYLRYLKDLKSLGLRITLWTWDEIIPAIEDVAKPLVERIIPRSDELSLFDEDEQPLYDYVLPLMSLPAALGEDAPTAANEQQAYIPAKPPVKTANMRIGLCWKAEEKTVPRKHRSLSDGYALELTKKFNADWISLVPDESLSVGMGAPISKRDSWLATRRLIETCDLIITVDTAVAHLAGAMGKPTWILLPMRRDWKWGMPESPYYWYPKTRYFQQSHPLNWAACIQDVAVALAELKG